MQEMKKGNYDQAVACYTEKINTSDVLNIDLYFHRANAYYKLFDYENAKKDIEVIFFKADTNHLSKIKMSSAYFLYGRLFSKQGNVEKELSCLLNALHYDKTPPLMSTLAFAFGKAKQYEKSVQYATMAIEMATEEKDGYAYNNRALSQVMLGHYDLAEKDVQKSLQIDPKNPYAYKTLGILYVKLNRKQEACDAFHKAIALGYRRFGDEADKDQVDLLIGENCP
jgi:tetratricopeptide (TPR) repeat protein